MVRRVVLGTSSLAVTVALALADRRGSLRVVTADESQASTLRDAGIDVLAADPTDEATLGSLAGADLIAALDADDARNLAAVRAATAVYPDAHVIGAVGADSDPTAASMASLADRVVDRRRATTEFLLARVGDDGRKLRQLLGVLRGIDDLAVVSHDNPDPDAIASAVALARIADAAGCRTDVVYYGEITHEENRAFVNLLEFDLENPDPGEGLEGYDGFALVDHSRPGVNDQLPADLAVDVVIDHHPPRVPVEARYVDLRSEAGATSTLLVDYLTALGRGFDEDVATGLLFGIRVDTDEFTRQVSPADFRAAATLLPHADLGLLEQIETPSISGATLETFAEAIDNRVREGPILLSCVGQLGRREALAQAADRLLALDGVTTTIVYGVVDGTIYASARSRGTDLDLGEILRDAFDQIGSAGGHADMAGAQIRLGVLESVEGEDESIAEVVEAVVRDRFLESLRAHSEHTVTGVYATDAIDTDEYLVPDEERRDAPGGG